MKYFNQPKRLSSLFVVISIFISCIAVAQSKEMYSRAKVLLDMSQHTMMKLAGLGVAVDHGDEGLLQVQHLQPQLGIRRAAVLDGGAVRWIGFRPEPGRPRPLSPMG